MSYVSRWVEATFPLTMTTTQYAGINGLHSYLELTASLAGYNKLILEVGIGSGLGLAWWLEHGYRAAGVELDEDVLALARKRFCRMGLGNLPLLQADAFDLPDLGTRVICHEGLLEHLPRPQRLALIHYHLSLASYVVVDIPTLDDMRPENGFGDEHLMPIEEWKKEWEDFNMIHFYRRATGIGAAFSRW